MNFFQRRSKLKKANYLELRPIKAAGWEPVKDDPAAGPDNTVSIQMPKFSSKFTKKYFEPRLKSPFIKINLDEIGSAAWLAIDGVKNVEMIAGELVEKFGIKVDPVEERLTKFYTHLYDQKLITFEELKGD